MCLKPKFSGTKFLTKACLTHEMARRKLALDMLKMVDSTLFEIPDFNLKRSSCASCRCISYCIFDVGMKIIKVVLIYTG